MMEPTIEIEGLDDLIRKLDKFPDKFPRLMVLSILRKGGKPVTVAARNKLLSHGNQYKDLAKSIGNITGKNKSKAVIYVGPRVKRKWKNIGYIAHWVEYGTKGIKKSTGSKIRNTKDRSFGWVKSIKKGGRYRADQPARPFMRPAIDAQINNVSRLLTDIFKKDLDKKIQKQFKKIG